MSKKRKQVSELAFTDAVSKFLKMQGNPSLHNDQRIGQYLINALVPGESCSDVFYEENARSATEKFWNTFVKGEDDGNDS